MKRIEVVRQGRAVAEQDGSGWLVVLPDGEVFYSPTQAQALARIREWAKKSVPGDGAGVLEVEWRFSGDAR